LRRGFLVGTLAVALACFALSRTAQAEDGGYPGGNTAEGVFALYGGNGNYNTATGNEALYFNVADNNTANGAFALFYNNSGNNNTATGFGALQHK
jgi:hypothetical protein